jgi:SAM-dependent methyltransferase
MSVYGETVSTVSPYDPIADFYCAAWADWYLPSVLPALQRIFFSVLPARADVLDICCGCGHITKELSARGYNVTGVDLSPALIAKAAKLLPDSQFVVADARHFTLDRQFDGALSTFDSLNHVLSHADLASAFRSAKKALKPGAPFFFDMNLEEAYSLDLGNWSRLKDENTIGFVRSSYDPTTRRGKTEVICFSREPQTSLWRRADTVVEEQCYSLDEIRGALGEGGFSKWEMYTASEAGVTDELGFGRLYVRAWA